MNQLYSFYLWFMRYAHLVWLSCCKLSVVRKLSPAFQKAYLVLLSTMKRIFIIVYPRGKLRNDEIAADVSDASKVKSNLRCQTKCVQIWGLWLRFVNRARLICSYRVSFNVCPRLFMNISQRCRRVCPKANSALKTGADWATSQVTLLLSFKPIVAAALVFILRYFFRHDSGETFVSRVIGFTTDVHAIVTLTNMYAAKRDALWKSPLHERAFLVCNGSLIIAYFYFYIAPHILAKEWLPLLNLIVFLLTGGPLLLFSLLCVPSIVGHSNCLDLSLLLLGSFSGWTATSRHIIPELDNSSVSFFFGLIKSSFPPTPPLILPFICQHTYLSQTNLFDFWLLFLVLVVMLVKFHEEPMFKAPVPYETRRINRKSVLLCFLLFLTVVADSEEACHLIMVGFQLIWMLKLQGSRVSPSGTSMNTMNREIQSLEEKPDNATADFIIAESPVEDGKDLSKLEWSIPVGELVPAAKDNFRNRSRKSFQQQWNHVSRMSEVLETEPFPGLIGDFDELSDEE